MVHSSEPIVVLTQDITSRVFSDRLVIGAIADLAAEQFEVAAYTALIAAAEHAGETEVARLCRLNRGEDEEMAEWLDAQIPIVIARTLAHRHVVERVRRRDVTVRESGISPDHGPTALLSESSRSDQDRRRRNA